jgi:hypothetical protein
MEQNSLKTDTQHVQLICDKGAKAQQFGKDVAPTNSVDDWTPSSQPI